MSRRVRAVIWNPQDGTNTLREEEIDTGLETLQGLVHGNIEGIYPGDFIPELEGVHGYVNGEFLYTHAEWRERPWRIGPYEYLCGPCVFLGSAGDGNEADCPASMKEIKEQIRISGPTMLAMLGDKLAAVAEQESVAPNPG